MKFVFGILQQKSNYVVIFYCNYSTNEFTIRISRDTLSLLKRYLQERRQSVVQNIIDERLYFDIYEGVARTKQQIEATGGAMLGEAKRQGKCNSYIKLYVYFAISSYIYIINIENRAKVYYGLLKEPDIQSMAAPAEEEEEAEGEGGDKPKKKKAKRDPLFSKKTKSDPNAPSLDRMPLPDL